VREQTSPPSNAAIVYKHWIVVIAVGAAIWFGMRWLYRYQRR
jgi:hypothetical protein